MLTKTNEIITEGTIKSKIYTIRSKQVMLDRDLATLYCVTTKRLNEQVKRNIKRFPSHYMFKITKEEMKNWRSQIATSNSIKMGLRRQPYVFTEFGVSQLSSILNSDIAIQVSIKIIDAFISMRKVITSYKYLFQNIDDIRQKQILYQLENDQKFDKVFKALESSEEYPKQGIFFNGQIFDAFKFVLNLIKKAKTSLVLIDNYIDESVLTMLDERSNKTRALIITKNINEKTKLMLEIHNKQYHSIDIKKVDMFHDRFLIIDRKELYHIGASIKDLGKKCFAFSKVDDKNCLNNLLCRI